MCAICNVNICVEGFFCTLYCRNISFLINLIPGFERYPLRVNGLAQKGGSRIEINWIEIIFIKIILLVKIILFVGRRIGKEMIKKIII